MNLRKKDNTSDLVESLIHSENGKVQKYVLERKRKEREFLEEQENIKKKNMMTPKLNQMFVKNENNEDKLTSKTIGLRTVDEYKKIKDEVFNKKTEKELDNRIKESKGVKTKGFNLSFCSDEESDEHEEVEEKEKEKNKENPEEDKNPCTQKIKKIIKDPTVNTSFLKDEERDRQIEEKKKELRELYIKLENEEKEKVIEITYSYYDGSGHRRKIKVKQKTTIGQFINKCVEDLKKDFTHLKYASSETLMFVKEDIILPNYLTFYELIKYKAQGKTGPLFAFDAVENLNGITDIRKEKTDTHAGKLIERKWYEKNKHIFPASIWEIYKPSKKYMPNYKDLYNNTVFPSKT